MLVTRTVTSTSWMYQGAQAYEKAAWVGVGLFYGFIYFRNAYDNLNKGERVLRTEFFVELSDGSTYPLGDGASREKITITNLGINPDGNVSLKVEGRDDMGIGVHRILRHDTIEFDDGRVPVLDTDQLNGILAELNDSLTTSMVNTAEAVKAELRDELQTGMIDVKDQMESSVNSKIHNAREEISTEIDQDVEAVKSDLSGIMDSKVEAAKGELLTNVDSKISVAKEDTLRETDVRISNAKVDLNQVWTDKINSKIRNLPGVAGFTLPGHYTIETGYRTNMMDTAVSFSTDGSFSYSKDNKSVILADGVSQEHRIVTVTAQVTFKCSDISAKGYIYMQIVNPSNTVYAQDAYFFDRTSQAYSTESKMCFKTSIFLRGGTADHPLFTTGLQVKFFNNLGKQMRIEADTTIMFSGGGR